MFASQNKNVVRRLADNLWNQRDLGVIDVLVAEDFVEHSPPVPGLPAGRAGFRRWAEGVLRAFPDSRLQIADLVAREDRICLRWRFLGTHCADYFSLAATGRKIDVPGMSFYHLADGLLIARWIVQDNLSMLRQLSVVD